MLIIGILTNLAVWYLWCLICYVIMFKIKIGEVHYIYVKKTDKKSLGWVWTFGKLCIVRLKGEHIKEFKIFWDNPIKKNL